MIPETERRVLLAIARAAIAGAVESVAPVVTAAIDSNLRRRRAGVFVTLRSHGELRGCIGRISADRALIDVVSSCAVAAAQADPRFPPVSAGELPRIEIELSVLDDFEAVRHLGEIEIGRHGLMVEHGGRSGLLLPQVAPEWEWDAETFVAHTCRKAGLPPDAWPAGGAIMHRFEAEVFGDAPAALVEAPEP